jgi:hypothetical protein
VDGLNASLHYGPLQIDALDHPPEPTDDLYRFAVKGMVTVLNDS